jgi:hypothetical protein
MRLPVPTFVAFACITLASGGTEPGEDVAVPDLLANQSFVEYWLDGKAELTRYDLEQARHGEIHAGDVVLIFETSGHPPGEPVKTGGDPVLKLGFTKRFNTGMIPCSTMTSVVTPIRFDTSPRTLETVTSVQEWSGHSWLQLELGGEDYRVMRQSSIEPELDGASTLEAVWLEDEIWTRIRLAPSSLPTGMVRIVPGGEQSSLRRRPLAVETARVSLEEVSEGVMIYALRYPKLERKLAIRFEKAFPHTILGWEEWDKDPLGSGARSQTTRATRAESIRLDFRNRTGKNEAGWRKKLGLD